MTRKRRYLFSAAALVACVCVAVGVLAALPRSGVTKANFDRIEYEMTREEVEAILGEPEQGMHGGGVVVFQWRRVDGAIIHVVMELGAVADKQFHSSTETIADKFRRWLHIAPLAAPTPPPLRLFRPPSLPPQVLPPQVLPPDIT
jgi:hypothetical protein